MNRKLIGYPQALQITLETISCLESERISLSGCTGRVVFEPLYSRVDSPSTDASMKDGYAVRSEDIASASPKTPVELEIIGTAAAGGVCENRVVQGTAVRILTGAGIPEGACAVLSEEFAGRKKTRLTVYNTAEPGRNILSKGTDVSKRELIAESGQRITPGLAGMLAAAGHAVLPVYRQPKVAILATGDELVVPGRPLGGGKLYASNLEVLKAWCARFDFQTTVAILSDKPERITQKISQVIKTHDAVITSGGAWTGDRDFVGRTLDSIGWKKLFHRIRIGPGKAVGFGLLEYKPVFLLPGGPPSNLTAFLQIALPGLMKLAGYSDPSLFTLPVKLTESIQCRNKDWTEFIFGDVKQQDDHMADHMAFAPLKLDSRLKSMAAANAVVMIPEGVDFIPAKEVVSAQVFM